MVFGRVIGRSAHWIAVPALVASFLGSCVVFARVWSGQAFTTTLFTWIVAADFETTVVALVDPLTGVMLLVVTGVGMLIHVYSIGYMHDDPGYARFFAYLNLFVFSMTMLVLAGNFLLLYVFWEAVGLCSYLLIGFWYTRRPRLRRARRRSSSIAWATSVSASASSGCGRRSARSTTRTSSPRRATWRRAWPPVSRSCSSWARAGNRRSFRCTSGSRTRWKDRPRCPRSSTRPRW